jgi:hypothetical protein
MVPKSHACCTRCISNRMSGDEGGGPCRDHLGKDGAFVDYAGPDVYEPSDWVLTVVGKWYRGFDERVYLCFGYDPRSGFWMRTTEGEEPRERNVSEAAIDCTYHQLREGFSNRVPTCADEDDASSEDRREWALEDKYDLDKEGGWEPS